MGMIRDEYDQWIYEDWTGMTMNMRTSDVEMLSGSLLLFEQGMQLFAPFAPFVKTYCTLFFHMRWPSPTQHAPVWVQRES